MLVDNLWLSWDSNEDSSMCFLMSLNNLWYLWPWYPSQILQDWRSGASCYCDSFPFSMTSFSRCWLVRRDCLLGPSFLECWHDLLSPLLFYMKLQGGEVICQFVVCYHQHVDDTQWYLFKELVQSLHGCMAITFRWNVKYIGGLYLHLHLVKRNVSQNYLHCDLTIHHKGPLRNPYLRHLQNQGLPLLHELNGWATSVDFEYSERVYWKYHSLSQTVQHGNILRTIPFCHSDHFYNNYILQSLPLGSRAYFIMNLIHVWTNIRMYNYKWCMQLFFFVEQHDVSRKITSIDWQGKQYSSVFYKLGSFKMCRR